MDKKTLSKGLIVLSIIAVVLAAFDWLSADFAPLGLGAESWVAVAIALAVYAVYTKVA